MQKTLIVTLFLSISGFLFAQAPRFTELDKSPMDMAYFPADYPIQKIRNKVPEMPLARLIYSRPQRQGRKVFGELVEYGKVWRLGANEATEVEFFKDARIGGKKIPKGRYTLYAIVNEGSWTFILNKETDVWGAFKYDPKKDLVRTEITTEKMDENIESLSMNFEKSEKGANLVIAWEQVKVSVPIVF